LRICGLSGLGGDGFLGMVFRSWKCHELPHLMADGQPSKKTKCSASSANNWQKVYTLHFRIMALPPCHPQPIHPFAPSGGSRGSGG